MKLLTDMASNPKTKKGLADGRYIGRLLHLAHADTSGLGNVCGWHRHNLCSGPCLDNEGRGHTPDVRLARLARTVMFFRQRAKFDALISEELEALEIRAAAEQKQALARLDATSDLGLAQKLCAAFPSILFFDYTKSIARVVRHVAALKAGRERNYYLTFSLGAGNLREAHRALALGVNVTAVFRARPADPVPAHWRGFDVVDGDVDDWRFKDPTPVWVALRSKGSSYHDLGGFILDNPAAD